MFLKLNHGTLHYPMIRKLTCKKDWEAAKRLGKTPDKVKEENKHVSQFKMPGTDLAQNRDAIKAYNQSKASGE